ncbi:MAG: phosphatidylserine/phosphatidylglycerophosphate/cardiolipin synthase family protein [Actinomycetota bacterium]|nr:phosphatidylserine/phosphatidylglycerophosphate/cardiolipin synthase family protein [Actinomycetota bacterium]
MLFRAKVVRKILVTSLIGGMAYYFTDLTNQPQIWALSASVFIGGITLVVQFLNDFESRLENVEQRLAKHSAEVRSLIEEGFARTNEATELFQAVEASALQTDAVTQLVRHSTQIDPDSPPLVYGFAQLQITRMSQFLKELSEGGDVSYDGEDRDWILGLTMQSRKTIIATSLSTVDAGGESFGGGLWTSDFGLRYLELQREAVRRGVDIRRVFIVDRPEQTDEVDLPRICRQQKDLGIQVKVLNRSDIPDALLFDFVVFDDAIGYEVTPASRVDFSMEPMIVKTNLIRQPERVDERTRRFEDLWASARELE